MTLIRLFGNERGQDGVNWVRSSHRGSGDYTLPKIQRYAGAVLNEPDLLAALDR